MMANCRNVAANAYPGGSKLEWTSYPHDCGWLEPGVWYHVAMAYSDGHHGKGEVSLFMNGQLCLSSSSSSLDSVALPPPGHSAAHQPLARSVAAADNGDTLGERSTDAAGTGRRTSNSSRIGGGDDGSFTFGGFGGYISDVRLYDGAVSASTVATLYTENVATYNATSVRVPSEEEIARTGRGYQPVQITPALESMRKAWLNYPSNASSAPPASSELLPGAAGAAAGAAGATHSKAPARRYPTSLNKIISPFHIYHPAMQTAVDEVVAGFPELNVVAGSSALNNHGMAASSAAGGGMLAGSIVLATCNDTSNLMARIAHTYGAAIGRDMVCPPAIAGNPEAFAIRMVPLPVTPLAQSRHHQHDDAKAPETLQSLSYMVVVAGGGPAGLLYGAFALAEHVQLQLPWTATALSQTEVPATSVRLINHWSQWRGFPFDAWCNQSTMGRADSLFSWDDLKGGAGAGNAAQTINDWARLLASVRINAVAPQDVNWDGRDNFLQHLDRLPAFGAILRKYAIRVYWTPNFLLAPLAATADALYAAIPDFGGYLLKIGSEKQGGVRVMCYV